MRGAMVYVSADFISRAHRMSKSHVWKLASVNAWRRRKVGRSVEYALPDVDDTLSGLARRVHH